MEKSIEEALSGFKNDLYQDLGIQESKTDDHLSVKRNGNFTGSGFKKLMTCKSRAKGKDWSTRKWLVDFGDTAINYCLEKAVERITGERVDSPTTWQMQWGTNHEPVAREAIFEKYGTPMPEQDFMFFLINAGSTPDSFNESNNRNVEIKCPPKHLNHAKYLHEPVSEDHEYFWQIQAEMMSQSAYRDVDVSETQFYTFHPAFSESTRLGGSIVTKSEVHCRAMKIRCIIGERLISKLVADDLRKMPQSYLPEIIADIPDDFEGLIEWYEKEIKFLEV